MVLINSDYAMQCPVYKYQKTEWKMDRFDTFSDFVAVIIRIDPFYYSVILKIGGNAVYMDFLCSKSVLKCTRCKVCTKGVSGLVRSKSIIVSNQKTFLFGSRSRRNRALCKTSKAIGVTNSTWCFLVAGLDCSSLYFVESRQTSLCHSKAEVWLSTNGFH